MEQFQYYTPTKVIFGKDTHKQVGAVIRSYGFNKVLFHYGSGSIKRTGVYDQIVQSAENTFFGNTENSGKKAVSQMAVVFKACAEKISHERDKRFIKTFHIALLNRCVVFINDNNCGFLIVFVKHFRKQFQGRNNIRCGGCSGEQYIMRKRKIETFKIFYEACF